MVISKIMLISCLLVLLFVGCISSEDSPSIPPNPCPEVFNYFYESDGNIFGEILVPNDGSMVYRMEVNTSYVGIFDAVNRPKLRLDLTTSQNNLLEARQLTYRLTFTRQDQVPRITQIKFNDRIYCRGPSAPLTSAGLSDMWVFKETRLQKFTYYPDQPIRDTKPSKPTIPPFIPPRTTTAFPWVIPEAVTEVYESPSRPEPIMMRPQNDQECGISEPPGTINLITDGTNTSSNEFPWLVALYEWKGLNYEFRCTANLIDRSHVITVASCLKFYKSNLVNTADIMLIFGSLNLKQWAGKSGIVIRRVAQVETNPEYTQYSGHGDMAILTLNEPVNYSKSIRPICLWNGPSDINEIVGTYGTVAGWGKDDHQMEFMAEAKKLEMPVVSARTCERSNPEFTKLISEKTFCAGSRNGRGPCTGDIGSPFMLENNGKWYIRGMVSKAILDRRTSQCNLNEYIVFSDIVKYLNWIETTLHNGRLF